VHRRLEDVVPGSAGRPAGTADGGLRRAHGEHNLPFDTSDLICNNPRRRAGATWDMRGRR
jgi:hypothetical protein